MVGVTGAGGAAASTMNKKRGSQSVRNSQAFVRNSQAFPSGNNRLSPSRPVSVAGRKTPQIPSNVETVPDEDDRKHEGILKKRTVALSGAEWLERRLILTKESLYICRVNTDVVIEKVPLLEVMAVEVKEAGKYADEPITANLTGSFKKLRKSHSGKKVTDSSAVDEKSNRDPNKPKLEISTIPDGLNCGRRYCFQCKSNAERDDWISRIQTQIDEAREESSDLFKLSLPKMIQGVLQKIFRHPAFEIFFALIIVATFINSITVAELQPDPEGKVAQAFETCDSIFTFLFIVSLVSAAFGDSRVPSDRCSVFRWSSASIWERTGFLSSG